MEQDFLSVKEFAAAVGVSVQAIYKRLKKDDDVLNNYVKDNNGKTFISASAIEEIFNISRADKKAAAEYIEYLKEELKKKDDIINNLLNKLEQQTEILTREQQLHLLSQQKILMLEEKTSRKGIFNLFKRKNKEVEQW